MREEVSREREAPAVSSLTDRGFRYKSTSNVEESSFFILLVNILDPTDSQLMTESGHRASHCPRTCRKTKGI